MENPEQSDLDAKFKDPGIIVKEWYEDPDRPIFIIDETRRSVYECNDQLIMFVCVCLRAGEAIDFLKNINRARPNEESYKANDIIRMVSRPALFQLLSVYCNSIEIVNRVNVVYTTTVGLKKSKKTKARIHLITDESFNNRSSTMEGPELNTVIHLVLKTAIEIGIGSRQVDVILDRSDQIGMSPGKRRLPPRSFEVFGPSRLDRRSDGKRAYLETPAEFRLIADSDNGPFRDLLVLPDLFGHLILNGMDQQKFKGLYKSLADEPFIFHPLDMSKMK